MSTSLFVEHHPEGMAFYLNGDLQFDTADEALYHEYLVVPPLAVVSQRLHQTPLRVLICGGGDGLAARDALRFPHVCHIDLVDYNPEVVELGQTLFQPFNQGSLSSDRLSIHLRNAIDFIADCADSSYHVILCDFTYPTCAEDTQVYSQEWFQQVQRVLHPEGLVATNGVSPHNRTTGFWCLYQTLLAANLAVRPMHLSIPSFQRHGYGDWGFFLGSTHPISRAELATIALPDALQTLTLPDLLQTFRFPAAIATQRHDVTLHSQACPQLWYYLLNPTPAPASADSPQPVDFLDVDFLDITEIGTAQLGSHDLLRLESVTRLWLEQVYQSEDAPFNAPLPPDLAKLLPVQHPYHSPRMTQEWLSHIQRLLMEVDGSKLLAQLAARAQELPPRLANDLKQLMEDLRTGKTLSQLPAGAMRVLTVLTAILLMANLVAPDAVFAKGYYRRNSYNNNYDSNYGSSSGDAKFLGLVLTIAGIAWLVNIIKERDE